jgi:hypothetical protein
MGKRTVMLCMVMLLVVVAVGGTAYAAIHGTQRHDWGRNKDTHPPGCPNPCGKALFGNSADNTIYGHKGWDAIWAAAGNDVAYGGRGMEQAYGRNGRDKLYGQRGHDHLFGGDGEDRLFLQDGRDEEGHVEQAHGGTKRDRCVLDEDTREGIIVTFCETLVIKSVKGMKGATKVAYGEVAWERRNFLDRKFYPGIYHRVGPASYHRI